MTNNEATQSTEELPAIAEDTSAVSNEDVVAEVEVVQDGEEADGTTVAAANSNGQSGVIISDHSNEVSEPGKLASVAVEETVSKGSAEEDEKELPGVSLVSFSDDVSQQFATNLVRRKGHQLYRTKITLPPMEDTGGMSSEFSTGMSLSLASARSGMPRTLQLDFQPSHPGAFPMGGRRVNNEESGNLADDDDGESAVVAAPFQVTATWVHEEDEEQIRQEMADLRIELTKKKGRRATRITLILVALVLVVTAVIVGTVVGLSSNNGDLPAIGTDVVVLSPAPTMAPTFPLPKTRVFTTTEELYQAVFDYFEAGYTTKGEGIHNMATWNVSILTNFESVFDVHRREDFSAHTFNDPAVNSWDMSGATTLRRFFAAGHRNLAGVFNQPLDNWDTSRVRDFYLLFYHQTAFNQDLSSWDTSSATTMESTFAHMDSFNGDISTWNMSNVRTMRGMFGPSRAFNRDISNWDVSRTTSLYQTFYEAFSFNQDISRWNVSKVECFFGTLWRAEIFHQDLCSWDIRPAQEQICQDGDWGYNMFWGSACSHRNEPGPLSACKFCGTTTSNNSVIPDDNMTTGRVFTTTEELYSAVDAYTEQGYTTKGYGAHDMTRWNVSLLTDFSSVFDYQRNRTSLLIEFNDPAVNSWDVSRATNMSRMFRGGIAEFEQLFNHPLDRWQTKNVEDFSGMFEYSRFDQDLVWDTSSAETMEAMFSFANRFDSDVESFNTSKVTNLNRMFYRAFSFNQPVGHWDVSRVTTMYRTFAQTGNFNQDISHWNVTSVQCFQETFDVAVVFAQDLCSWDFNVDNQTCFPSRTFRVTACPIRSVFDERNKCFQCDVQDGNVTV